MKPTKMTLVTLVAIAVSVAAAAPALADYTYGCTLPMIPLPERLLDRTLNARELVRLIQETGVIEIKSDQQQSLFVRPRFTIESPGGRETLTQGDGEVAKVNVGRHPIARAIDPGPAFPLLLERALRRFFPGDHFVVHSVTTLKHGAPLRFPGDHFALTLEFVNARPADGEPVNSHKLVLFLASPRAARAAQTTWDQ